MSMRATDVLKLLACCTVLLITGCGGGSGSGGAGATGPFLSQPPGSGSTPTFSVSVTVSGLAGSGLVLKNNGGDNLAIDANGVKTFATALVSGASYAVTVATAPSSPAQICSVGNAAGAITANVVNITVACQSTARFAYVVNKAAGTISRYTVDPVTGVLTGVGAPTPTVANPSSIIVDANGKFAYVSSGTASVIAVFAIDQTTGALTSAGPAAASSGSLNSIGMHPNGKLLYAASRFANTMDYYVVDATTGLLTNNGNVNAGIGTGPTTIAFDPAGKFLYVALYDSARIAEYIIDPVLGTLSTVGPFTSAGLAPSIAIHPSGKILYYADETLTIAAGFFLNSFTGRLFGNVGGYVTGTNPAAIVIEPTGRFAYVPNFTSSDVSSFTVDESGGMGLVGPVTASGTNPVFAAIDPTGRFLYVVNKTSNNVSTYSIDAVTGVLTPTGLNIAAGATPVAIAVTK